MRLQTDTEIEAALERLVHWRLNARSIRCRYSFADFATAIDFVRAVALVAEEVQHHPDIDIRWNQVTLTLTTQDMGGLTELDFQVAERCDLLSGPWLKNG